MSATAPPPDLSAFAPPAFRPHPLLGSRHVQTSWSTIFPRRLASAAGWREAGRPWRLALPDGDVMTGRLHLHPDDPGRTRPTVLLLHGLEGDAEAHYMRGVSAKAHALGWHSLRLNFRGCGDGAGLARRIYHGLTIEDVDAVLRALATEVAGPIALVGVSLGANKLLRLVATYGASPPPALGAAVAVSPPIDFILANEALGKGLNRMYDQYFLRKLRRKMPVIAKLHPDDPAVAARAQAARRARRLAEFDAAFTAPMGGFRDALEYYTRAGAGPVLGEIRVPTLIVAAEDDPFIPFAMFRAAEETIRANPWITTLYTPHGGHVGFMESPRTPRPEPWMDEFWSENASLLYLREVLPSR
jgi:predicted alpha/beta-fold hydrolase